MLRHHQALELQAEIDRIAAERAAPLEGLLRFLLDGRNLAAAWERVAQARGARTPGVDGVVCRDVEDRVDDWLGELAAELYSGRYRPDPIRPFEVSGSHGRQRTLGILTVRDRVVHAAMKQVLEPIFERGFSHRNHGYRPGRSVSTAVCEAARSFEASYRRRRMLRQSVTCDVQDCFGSIGQPALLRVVARRIGDEGIMTLLRVLLDGQGRRRGVLSWRGETGIVQGSSLSPLLANIHLDRIDAAVRSEPGLRDLAYLRYADDLLVLTRDARSARGAARFLRRRARGLGLRLNVSAVRAIEGDGFEWLGLTFRQRCPGWRDEPALHHEIPGRKVIGMLERIDEMTAPPSDRIDGSAVRLDAWTDSLNEQLLSWHQAYHGAHNALDVFAALDQRVQARMRVLICRVERCRPSEVSRRYGVRLRRGFRTLAVEGRELVVLSAMPPRAAGRRPRLPEWRRCRRRASHQGDEVILADQRSEGP